MTLYTALNNSSVKTTPTNATDYDLPTHLATHQPANLCTHGRDQTSISLSTNSIKEWKSFSQESGSRRRNHSHSRDGRKHKSLDSQRKRTALLCALYGSLLIRAYERPPTEFGEVTRPLCPPALCDFPLFTPRIQTPTRLAAGQQTPSLEPANQASYKISW